MEYSNPFDAPQGRFYILENAAGQFSLWPENCALPAGWQVTREPALPDECNGWLKENWTNLQPTSFAAPGGSQ
ncbi:MbtH family protein [Dryocola sp. BD626]|uniref:MbtH family protein n=1 Tax=Dryocola sp. BD626 TaxID=3133273 RepID=UPI003F503F76